MRDPFKPHTNHQLVREAQFGFTVIGLLVATLIYVAWFRLNGGDRLPEGIRDSPIAMQVYPNSPNYDSESHQMVASNSARQRFADPKSNQSLKAPKVPTAMMPLTEVPRKMMADSQRSARRLSKDAATIDRSVTKVATLLKPTKNKAAPAAINPPIIVNPLKEIEASAKLKPTLSPSPKERLPLPPATDRLPIGPSAIAPQPAKLPAITPAPARKSNDFKALEPKAPPTTKPSSTDSNPNHFSPFQSSSFKSSSASALSKANATASLPKSLPKPEPTVAHPTTVPTLRTSEASVFPSLRSLEDAKPQKLTPQPFPPLRPTPPTPQPSPKFETSAATETSNVQTVSFESTTWKVKRGDSFWSIAQQSYGDGRFFRALYESNRARVPGFENLRENVELDIPSEAQLIARHPSLCPADAVHRNDPCRATPNDVMKDLTDSCDMELQQRFYETKAKDTLFGVAQRELGQASRYVDLLELNRFRIPADSDHQTLLPTGIQLLMPQH